MCLNCTSELIPRKNQRPALKFQTRARAASEEQISELVIHYGTQQMVSQSEKDARPPNSVELNKQLCLPQYLLFMGCLTPQCGMQNTKFLIFESFPLLEKPKGCLTELGVGVLSPRQRESADCCSHW